MIRGYKEIGNGVFAKAEYVSMVDEVGLGEMDSVFAFNGGKELRKANLSGYRSRVEFEHSGVKYFLKRYNNVPFLKQLRSWVDHFERCSTAGFEYRPCERLREMGINTPETVAFGEQWSGLFEKRSFYLCREIEGGESLERRKPACFLPGDKECEEAKNEIGGTGQQRDFIKRLANFIRSFHETGYRHRDLYLCHIFMDGEGEFHLIDLARAFVPRFFSERYRVKDISQLYYSSPGNVFGRTDRMRFYLEMAGIRKLKDSDKRFIRRVLRKVDKIASHDKRHDRNVPFAN